MTVQPLITGADAAFFEVLDANTLTPFTGEVLEAGEFVDLLVRFNADSPVEAEALLQLLTDQNAPFAAGGTPAGDVFSFQLSASAVPEPSTIVCWCGLLAVGMAAAARRRLMRR
jgi:hypothetical protein